MNFPTILRNLQKNLMRRLRSLSGLSREAGRVLDKMAKLSIWSFGLPEKAEESSDRSYSCPCSSRCGAALKRVEEKLKSGRRIRRFTCRQDIC